MNQEYKIYDGTLYDYTAGVYCGVLVTEAVMRKLAALQHAHLESVKRLLSDNKDSVFPSGWTLHYPDGKQTEIRYIDKQRSVDEAIEHASIASQPKAKFPVFIGDYDKVKEMADARHAALSKVTAS